MKAARRHAKLTQVQLAERVGITQQTLSALERDENEGSAKMLDIAIECGVSAQWLARGVGEMLDGWQLNRVAEARPGSQVARLDPETIRDAKFYALSALAPDGHVFDAAGDVDVFIAAYDFAAELTPESRDRFDAAIEKRIALAAGGGSGEHRRDAPGRESRPGRK